MVMVVVFDTPILCDRALKLQACIGDRQSRSGYRALELLGIDAAEVVGIQKILVILLRGVLMR